MPRRSILSAAERENLLALAESKDELIRHYTLAESDLSIIRGIVGPRTGLGLPSNFATCVFPALSLVSMSSVPALAAFGGGATQGAGGKLGRIWSARADPAGTFGRITNRVWI